MEKEFFIDSDGNLSNDQNRFLEEYEDFWKNNPEKLTRLNELKQEKKNLRLKENYPMEISKWILEHGEFKTAIEFFYRKELIEHDEGKNKEGYIKSLLKRKEAYGLMIDQFKRYKKLYPKLHDEYGFAIKTIKSLQNIINFYSKRIEDNQKKTIIKNKILAFNNNIEESLGNIEIILLDFNKLLFENSTIQDWEQLLKGNILENPINVKRGVTMKDLKYLFVSLQNVNIKVLKGNVYTDFERNRAFFWKGSILTAIKLQKEPIATEPKLKDEIDTILQLITNS